MNDRIRECAQQAGIKLIAPTGHITAIASNAQSLQLNKFAEIIVFECIKIALLKGDSSTGRAIKEHFGIED